MRWRDSVQRRTGVLNCDLDMSETFDIGLERLTAGTVFANRTRVAAMPTGPAVRGTFFLETFGCQMNDHDSEKVAGVLMSRGYRQVESPDTAALILYNTCSIREKAAQKVFSRLGEYRTKQAAGQVIGVLGCVAQQGGEDIFERAPWVSLVCGSASYSKLPELLEQVEAGNQRVTGLDTDTDATFETEMTRRDNPWRAYLTIIEGCDKACSYCVVPYTLGPERSRASDSILREVRQLAELGYSEVQLLGQTVNSYADPTARKMRFSELLLAVADEPGIRRVRFTTSHPRDFTPDIVDAIESQPKLCNHVGLPGETEADLAETLSLLDEVKYDAIFSFKYSPRPHTPSLSMSDAIPEEEKSRRLAILQERQREIQLRRHDGFMGMVFEVLVSGKSRKENQWSGHTSCHRVINFTSQEAALLGKYVQVRVTGTTPNCLVGERDL